MKIQHTRNPFIIHYGDQLLSILFFLNIFLELDDPNRFARQKVSKTKKKKRNKKKTSEKTKNHQQLEISPFAQQTETKFSTHSSIARTICLISGLSSISL